MQSEEIEFCTANYQKVINFFQLFLQFFFSEKGRRVGGRASQINHTVRWVAKATTNERLFADKLKVLVFFFHLFIFFFFAISFCNFLFVRSTTA